MRFLILGGGGFIGSHLSETLLHAGYDVRVFEKTGRSKDEVSHIIRQIDWVEGDYLNPSDLVNAVKEIDVIVHLISTTQPRGSNLNPVFDVSTNVVPTIELLNAACKAGVKKVIFSSSGGTVYGVPTQVPVRETHPTDPQCSYGIHKLAVEKYLALYRQMHGLDYTVMRISNPYGEHQDPKGMLGAATVFLYKTLLGEEIEIWGDGSVVRDYLHISDVAGACLKILDYKGKENIFNIGYGTGVSLNKLLETISEVTGIKPKVRYVEGRGFDVKNNVLDITRAKTELGWTPEIPLEEGLARMAKHFKSVHLK
jgi:UDP-glucose 4-epimerase